MSRLIIIILVLIIISCSSNQENARTVVELDSQGDTVSMISIKGEVKEGPLTRYGLDNKKSVTEFYENDTLVRKVYYYESGNIGSEGPIVNNLPNGLWLHYYENGSLRSKIDMKNGEASGEFIQYYRNGKIEMKGEDMSGNGIFEKYDSLGNPIWKLMFKNGEVIDTLKIY